MTGSSKQDAATFAGSETFSAPSMNREFFNFLVLRRSTLSAQAVWMRKQARDGNQSFVALVSDSALSTAQERQAGGEKSHSAVGSRFVLKLEMKPKIPSAQSSER